MDLFRRCACNQNSSFLSISMQANSNAKANNNINVGSSFGQEKTHALTTLDQLMTDILNVIVADSNCLIPSITLAKISHLASKSGFLMMYSASEISCTYTWRKLWFCLCGFRLYAFYSPQPFESVLLSLDLSQEFSVHMETKEGIIKLTSGTVSSLPVGSSKQLQIGEMCLMSENSAETREWFAALNSAVFFSNPATVNTDPLKSSKM